ncbi:hypothetical protein BDB01DRAFT_772386 [Pilobolus umbonatus]|nr:hypothetical protein BDB01DRAFT_772386 [Pilobolus umbonatus]
MSFHYDHQLMNINSFQSYNHEMDHVFTPDMSTVNTLLFQPDSFSMVNNLYYGYMSLLPISTMLSFDSNPCKVKGEYDLDTRVYPLYSYQTMNDTYGQYHTHEEQADETWSSVESCHSTISSPMNHYSSLSDQVVQKGFSCQYCKRAFKRKYDLHRHVRIHTGIKPYICPCCSKRFSRSDARIRHFKQEQGCEAGLILLDQQKYRNRKHSSIHKYT